MTRYINLEQAGKERIKAKKDIAYAMRELALQSDINGTVLDLISYIIITLNRIEETIDKTVVPWEKRGYWIKADKFRREWAWVSNIKQQLHVALVSEDWEKIQKLTIEIFSKVSDVKITKKQSLETPWVGSYRQLFPSKMAL